MTPDSGATGEARQPIFFVGGARRRPRDPVGPLLGHFTHEHAVQVVLKAIPVLGKRLVLPVGPHRPLHSPPTPRRGVYALVLVHTCVPREVKGKLSRRGERHSGVHVRALKHHGGPKRRPSPLPFPFSLPLPLGGALARYERSLQSCPGGPRLVGAPTIALLCPSGCDDRRGGRGRHRRSQ